MDVGGLFPPYGVMGRRYFVSKLFNLFFMRELASRVPTTSPLVVDAIAPGFCKSELIREARQNFVVNLIMIIVMALLARSTEQGGRTLLHAAVTTDPEKLLRARSAPEKVEALKTEGAKAAHGKFISTCRITEESDFAISEEGRVAQKRHWDETVEILQAVDPRVHEIIEKYLAPNP